ncbi:MAG: hypothetical protein D8M58_22320 [Calditrichaeota bacterium]|nr:MAG: hypothetical protein DWQ03_08490 [Calditrichota bacterium]MBL1208150.1 hypothetical protein [Calditrichota bacterium]NOG47988.1 hypothetical protein [Calditrichota bacterium]
MSKVGLSKIISDHFTTFKKYKTQEVNYLDYIVFIVLPLICSTLLIYFKVVITKELSSILITALSIFAALLFNLLLLVYDIINKNNHSDNALKQRFLKEIYSNISYSILVSIFSVIILIGNYYFSCGIIYLTINLIGYFFIFSFVLTLFMILKRIHILLSKEFS